MMPQEIQFSLGSVGACRFQALRALGSFIMQKKLRSFKFLQTWNFVAAGFKWFVLQEQPHILFFRFYIQQLKQVLLRIRNPSEKDGKPSKWKNGKDSFTLQGRERKMRILEILGALSCGVKASLAALACWVFWILKYWRFGVLTY